MADTDKFSFPEDLARDLHSMQWLEPWWCFCLDKPEFGETFEKQLQKELGKTHQLYSCRLSARAIAKREDCDDVLFWFPNAEQKLAIVHLTWSSVGETDSELPRTTLLNSLTEFVEQEMVPANREWSNC